MAEIAEIVGVPAGTVKSRLFHARQQLKSLLARRGLE
ncbi:MAG: sigma factor-like helix-turn-helix DNA-binding protein [bacterium]